jgi:hypothetical protein
MRPIEEEEEGKPRPRPEPLVREEPLWRYDAPPVLY